MNTVKDDVTNLAILRGGTMPTADDKPQSSLLEAFKNQFTDTPYMINLIFPEFTSLCPVTGQPDFGTIVIEYVPDKLCVESKGLKLYLFSYRNRGCFMETITNSIMNDLATLLDPCWLRVKGLFAPRGATRINVYAEKMSSSLPMERKQQLLGFLADWRSESHSQNHPLS